jgi:flagellar operon protein
MVNRLNLTTTQIQRPQGPAGVQRTPGKQGDFAATLAKETQRQESLTISQHAQKRLDSSQVKLTDQDMQRINGAVQKASAKGSNQSLVMLDDLALVVSIKNRVVITAVDEARTKEGVFTNIDSMVIA